jgi:LuxR family maltose regulon positive regulatory protein
LIKEQATESTGFLGKDTVGFINAAELEWQFEHDEIDSYDLNTSLNKIYHDADSKDSMNMCYVATGLMIRDFIAHGKFASAEMFFNNFLEKVESANNVDEELLKSLKAFRVRMELYKGNPNEASDWLDTTPNSMVFFSIQDRYIYVNKIRVLIIFKRFEEALSLIERLLISFERYNRPYYNIQILILKAILLYREDDPRWRDILVDALKRAEKYGYMRIFSDEGFALKPLLDKIEAPGVDKTYYGRIKELTNEMSINYPNYMKTVELIEDPLTDMERKVTKMMCAELTSEEICDMLHISYSGLKFHKQNIYKKLGVSNRQEAQRKAKSLGLDLQ